MSNQATGQDTPHYITRRSKRQHRQAVVRFVIFTLFMTSIVWYLANSGLQPPSHTSRLSAQPAPPVLPVDENWLDLPPMQRDYDIYTISKGGSLAQLLTEANVPSSEAFVAMQSMRDTFDARRLKSGQEVRVFWERPADKMSDIKRFSGFDFLPTPAQKIIVRRSGNQVFETRSFQRLLTERHFFVDTLVESSVYDAARNGGMAPSLVIKLIRIFSYNVDFQRDIRQGDQFEVLYSRRFDSNNNIAEEGDIIYAALTNKGERISMWGLKNEDGNYAYYDQNGKSAQKLLLTTPADGARLSSRYGSRKHPILGFTRMHRGLDFAAPRGTPVYAAGDGKITMIGKNGNFGNYIRIKHKNGFETAYAHMRGFAKGLKRGSTVTQGQTIGYIGTSGLSTGPHLHYEVLLGGKQVNPRTLALPPAKTLNEQGLEKLRQAREEINQRVRLLSAGQLARNSAP